MNINDTWKNQLAMSGWVAEKWEEGLSVEDLKEQWLEENGFKNLENNCFFCDYDFQIKDDCLACPAKLIDPGFFCSKKEYGWSSKPKQFLAEITRLNKIRLANES